MEPFKSPDEARNWVEENAKGSVCILLSPWKQTWKMTFKLRITVIPQSKVRYFESKLLTC